MTRRKLACLASLVLVSLSSTSASAQDAATAQVLFDQGKALMNEEKFAQACAKFAESQRLGPSSGTMLNLGECYAKQGKNASAWAAFKDALPLAHSANQPEREKYARDRIAQLEGSLVRLAIKVADAASDTPGLVVRRDGIELGKAAWGISVPVDPGSHVVEASAPKKKTWKATIEVSAEPKEVVVPALDEQEATAGPDTASRTFFTRRRIALGLGAVGVVGVTVGAVFGLGAISDNSDAKDHCRTQDLCSPEGLSLKDSARGKATLSTVFFVLGAAGLGAGAILFFTAPDDKDTGKPVSRLRLAPAVGPGAGGLSVAGAW